MNPPLSQGGLASNKKCHNTVLLVLFRSSHNVTEHFETLLVLISENVVPVGVEGAVTVAEHQDLLPGDVAEPHQAGARLSLPAVLPVLQSSPLARIAELSDSQKI